MNFSGVQSLACLVLPIAPAVPRDSRSPAASVRQGIRLSLFGISLGERIAAPVPTAGGDEAGARPGV